jgi:hypothetical protein
VLAPPPPPPEQKENEGKARRSQGQSVVADDLARKRIQGVD